VRRADSSVLRFGLYSSATIQRLRIIPFFFYRNLSVFFDGCACSFDHLLREFLGLPFSKTECVGLFDNFFVKRRECMLVGAGEAEKEENRKRPVLRLHSLLSHLSGHGTLLHCTELDGVENQELRT
jgi:hypothetical protein